MGRLESATIMSTSADKQDDPRVKINSFISNPNFSSLWSQEEDQVQEYLRDGRYNQRGSHDCQGL